MPQTTTSLPSPVALLPAPAEHELVQRLLARDERALGQLYEQYARNLFTVILRVVQDEAMAQDVLQEGLLKVWLSIGSYEATRGRLFTWMVRVCCNQAIDALRSPRHRFHRRNPSLEAAGAHYSPAPTAFYPEHIGVRELIVQLKPRQREVMDLLYFGGCTQAETAEQLAIPLATVKTRARAALAVLSRMAR
ncbi:sigma-70 family RNA polymerase sigma factor (plasmid) [Hymenobacter aerilatus]|uniref:Sigma-70 family RNA polymerase sigma factor n=1 Tax=Hymenobacter aerilatus TaxID=2932251 RepID=A0A8T9T6U9_9BACT|nr:sigma-70 family RNA polymerase sigma factor [Hymenobacter aerilatus]UOR07776.1 sigma-70 family RNA polymerase sigma factor [Hymenobacter aerilatus]